MAKLSTSSGIGIDPPATGSGTASPATSATGSPTVGESATTTPGTSAGGGAAPSTTTPTTPPATAPASTTTPTTPVTPTTPPATPATTTHGPLVVNPVTVTETANTTATISASQLLSADQAPAPGDTLHLVSVSAPSHGTVSLTPSGDVSFTPDTGFTGAAGFTYTVGDAQFGLQGSAPVTANVAPPPPPTVVNDTVTATENTSTVLPASQLLANDKAAVPNDTLHISAVSGATNATVSLTPQGDVSFTPASGFSGNAAFNYTVADQFGSQASGLVTVTVQQPSFPPPAAGNGVIYLLANHTTTIPNDQFVINDTPLTGADPLHVASVSTPTNGGVALNAGTVTFTPTQGFTGTGSFTYTVADTTGETSNPATITVHIVPEVPPVSTNPLTFDTAFQTPLSFNAVQLEPDTQSYSPATAPLDVPHIIVDPLPQIVSTSHGTVSFDQPSGQVIFTPDQGFVGQAGFDYQFAGTRGGPPITVNVDVAPPPPPTVVKDTFNASENTAIILPASQVLANDHASAANDTLHISAVSGAENAVVNLTPQGDISFTPNQNFVGVASFDYTATDQYNQSASASVAVNVMAAPSPIPPTPTPSPSPAPLPPPVIENQVIQQIIQVDINILQQITVGPTTIVVQPPIQPVPTPTTQPLVYFDGTSQAFGSELWSSNGRTVGQAVDINPGPPSSFPADITAIGSLLYFSADNGIHGRQPWTFDGSHAQMLADINPTGSSDPTAFTQLGHAVFFTATDGVDGRQVWESSPTAGVQMVTDINPGPTGAIPANLTPLGDTLYFTATDAQHGAQLWALAAGSQPAELTSLNPGPVGALPDDLTALGNSLFFIANDGTNGRQLFSVTGTGAPVEQVVTPGPNGAFPAAGSDNALLTVGTSDLYFVANGPGQTPTLYHEHAGGPLQPVATLANLTAPLAAVQAAEAGNNLYFAVTDANGTSELARFNTATGQLTANIAPDLQSAPSDLTAVGNDLFFTVLNHATQGNVAFRDLYADNGQTTQKVALGSQQTLPHDLTASQGQLFFADHGQLETVNPHGPLAATILTVSGGDIYVPIDIAPAPHEVLPLV